MEDRSPPEDRSRRDLALLRASGVRLVAVRAPDGAPEECLADDETVYDIERALAESPLPHSPACACFYAPRGWEDWEPTAARAPTRGDQPEELPPVPA